MPFLRILLLSVFFGLLGGFAGAFLVSYTFGQRVFDQTLTLIPRTRSEVRSVPAVQDATASLMWLFQRTTKEQVLPFSRALGVGVVLSSDGLIATSSSIKNPDTVVAAGIERRPRSIEFVVDGKKRPFTHAQSGLTFFKLKQNEETPLTALRPVSSVPFEEILVGAHLFALGGQGALSFHRVVERTTSSSSKGAISSEEAQGLLRVDGDPQAGSFLFDEAGRFVGVVSERGGVIPGELVTAAVRHYLKGDSYVRTVLGVKFRDVSGLVILDKALPSRGLLIAEAAKDGILKKGDVLVSFDGQRLDGMIPLQILLQRYLAGAEVELVVFRDGKEEKFKVVLKGE